MTNDKVQERKEKSRDRANPWNYYVSLYTPPTPPPPAPPPPHIHTKASWYHLEYFLPHPDIHNPCQNFPYSATWSRGGIIEGCYMFTQSYSNEQHYIFLLKIILKRKCGCKIRLEDKNNKMKLWNPKGHFTIWGWSSSHTRPVGNCLFFYWLVFSTVAVILKLL